MVLLILALMTTLIAFMVEAEHIAIRRTTNATQAEQGYQAALSGEQWALAVLRADIDQDQSDPIQNDHLEEDWAKVEKPPVSIPDAEISVKIIDESAKFNLNNLYIGSEKARQNPPKQDGTAPSPTEAEIWRRAFEGLLQTLKIDDDLHFAVEQYLDYDDDSNGRISDMAAEDNDYLSEDPPYRAPNRLMEDLSELRRIKGFDDEVIAKLRPYVTVLPSYGARINANTCDPKLFTILFRADSNLEAAYISEAEARTLEELRGQGNNGIQEFEQRFNEALPSMPFKPAFLFDEKSRYFRIISRTKVGRLSYGIESLVRRTPPRGPGDDPGLQVVQRRRTLG